MASKCGTESLRSLYDLPTHDWCFLFATNNGFSSFCIFTDRMFRAADFRRLLPLSNGR